MEAFKKIWTGLRVVAKTVLTSANKGEIEVDDTNGKINYHNGTSRSPVVTEAHTATLTNKSIDADGTGNSITNIDNADIKAGAAIDASKIADGSVSSTEFQYLANVTSDIQTQINTNATGLSDHLSDAIDAHDASAISNVPAGSIAATDVQAAINELDGDIQGHIADAVDAHDASAISNVPSGNLAATDVQSALNELQTDIDGKQASGNYITALTGDVTATGPGSVAATIANDAVSNAKLANMATQTIKGRTTAGTGDPEDLSATQATAILNNFVGDSGSGGTKGLVPAPAAGDATSGKFLKADGTWVAPASGSSTFTGAINFYPLGDAESASTGNFTTGNNATFDGGGTFNGTFTISTTAADLIRGLQTFKWVGSATAGNNTNNYIASTVIDIPQGYRTPSVMIRTRYRWDGTSGNMKVVVKDQTNITILSASADVLSQYIDGTNKTSTEIGLLITIPATCTQIKVGFQCVTGEVSKTLTWDDFVVVPVSVDSARAVNTAGTSIPNTGNTKVPFDGTASISRGITFDTTNNRFTINRAGTYLTSSCIQFTDAVYTAGDSANLYVYKNGSEYSRMGRTIAWSGLNIKVGVSGSDLLDLKVGDYVEIFVQNDRTGGATALDTTANKNEMSITRVGGV